MNKYLLRVNSRFTTTTCVITFIIDFAYVIIYRLPEEVFVALFNGVFLGRESFLPLRDILTLKNIDPHIFASQ